MSQKNYIRTDLADECRARAGIKDVDESGIEFSESIENGITVSRLHIKSSHGEKALGKPQGNYITIGFKDVWLLGNEDMENLQSCISSAIRDMIKTVSFKIPEKVLIVGLGNRSLTCDAVGPLAAELVTVTRHLFHENNEIFQKLSHPVTCVISPGVWGNTGIESSELIKSAIEISSPDLVILIDALAARSPERLTRTVQLCNTGISPGAGVGNSRGKLDRESLGVPVIALGVPTVVDSSTLIYDALEKAGINEDNIPSALNGILQNGESFFVCTKECDTAVKELSKIISYAIDDALSHSFSS